MSFVFSLIGTGVLFAFGLMFGGEWGLFQTPFLEWHDLAGCWAGAWVASSYYFRKPTRVRPIESALLVVCLIYAAIVLANVFVSLPNARNGLQHGTYKMSLAYPLTIWWVAPLAILILRAMHRLLWKERWHTHDKGLQTKTENQEEDLEYPEKAASDAPEAGGKKFWARTALSLVFGLLMSTAVLHAVGWLIGLPYRQQFYLWPDLAGCLIGAWAASFYYFRKPTRARPLESALPVVCMVYASIVVANVFVLLPDIREGLHTGVRQAFSDLFVTSWLVLPLAILMLRAMHRLLWKRSVISTIAQA